MKMNSPRRRAINKGSLPVLHAASLQTLNWGKEVGRYEEGWYESVERDVS